ncbi:hypothetical protein N7510_010461 [Penicillium lagena]|uniref:uncharacterized protein n=1 Tax=Penicillium lagena TaxID=94218 RepID=UPI00254164B3|nr:uncharacterized protein N7510_010461 [Penicillium lagena]KAJ5605307.1 hypothetical protein N7510_010461 [Penicillium lagena]
MPEAKFDVVRKIHNYIPFCFIRELFFHWRDPAFKDVHKVSSRYRQRLVFTVLWGKSTVPRPKLAFSDPQKLSTLNGVGTYDICANAVAYGWIGTRITRPLADSQALMIAGQEIRSGIPLNAKK